MFRSERIYFRLSPREKRTLQRRAKQSSCSVTDFVRAQTLTDKTLAHATEMVEVEDWLSQLHVDLFDLRPLIEQELGVDLSRAAKDLDPHIDPLAFRFASFAAKLQHFHGKAKEINSSLENPER